MPWTPFFGVSFEAPRSDMSAGGFFYKKIPDSLNVCVL